MENKSSLKAVLWSLIAITIGLCIAYVIVHYGQNFAKNIFYRNTIVEPLESEVVDIKKEEKIPDTTLLFVGDIMLARGVKNSVVKNFGDNFDTFLSTIPEIAEADIAFANLEGPVSDRGRNVGSKFSFRFEPRVVPALKTAGFDVFSVANNHAGDWTLLAFTDTLKYLGEAGIKTAGGGITKSEAIQPSIIEKNGVKFGFIGFTDVGPNGLAATDTHGGLLLASDPDFETIITDAKSQVDILVVSFHWGVEYKEHNEHQTLLAHQAIDAGADLIVGHHPHIEQQTELYKNKLIIYSLGNFIFDQYFSPETMRGLGVFVVMNREGMVSYKKHRVVLNKYFQPHFEEYVEY